MIHVAVNAILDLRGTQAVKFSRRERSPEIMEGHVTYLGVRLVG